MSVPLQLFDSFVEALAEHQHDLSLDTLKVMLTNSAPSASADAVLADLTEISTGSGYAAGGPAITITGSSQSGGTYTLTASNRTITASGGTIGPFQYAVIYDDTASGDPLIGFYDYGSAITLADGGVFTIAWPSGIVSIGPCP